MHVNSDVVALYAAFYRTPNGQGTTASPLIAVDRQHGTTTALKCDASSVLLAGGRDAGRSNSSSTANGSKGVVGGASRRRLKHQTCVRRFKSCGDGDDQRQVRSRVALPSILMLCFYFCIFY